MEWLDKVFEDLQSRDIEIKSYSVIRESNEKGIRNSVYRLEGIGPLVYFLKIGKCQDTHPDDRSLQQEINTINRLIEVYLDDMNRVYAGLVTANRIENNIGYILLNYIDLTKWREPDIQDQSIVEEAILYLQNAGIIHLDITHNVLVQNNAFFWMDFETTLITQDKDKDSYESIYKKTISEIARMVCQGKMMPTPEIPRRFQSRIHEPSTDLFQDIYDQEQDDVKDDLEKDDVKSIKRKLF